MFSRSALRLRFLPVAVFVLIAATVARATTPAVAEPLPAGNFEALGAGETVDLRAHFTLPGVTGPLVQFDTDYGRFDVELHETAAPVTVANFLGYVAASAYHDSFIHRSIPNFIIQSGGFGIGTESLYAIPTVSPIPLEYNLPNVRGTLAMARTSELNSATSQWFINTVDNTTTLGQGNGGGYAVFGRVLGTGMDVVDAIADLDTYYLSALFSDIPLQGLQPGQTIVYFDNLVRVRSVTGINLHPSAEGGASVLTYSLENSAPGTVQAVLLGSTLTLTPGAAAGSATITVTATDTGGNHASSTFVAVVHKRPQTIVFPAPEDRPFASAGIALAAGASSGLPVTLEILSGPAIWENGLLRPTAAGVVTVRATQGGDATYHPAAPVEHSFTFTGNFLAWRESVFTAGQRADPAFSGPQAAPAGDGVPNLLKYALGLDPFQPAAADALPGASATGSHWEYHYTRPADRVELTYAVEASTDLAVWTTSGVEHHFVSGSDAQQTWRARVPRAAGSQVFFRLRVTSP